MANTIPQKVKDVLNGGSLYLLSWTTTPWSLAANRAIAFKEDALYVIVQDKNGNGYVIAKDLLKNNYELAELFTEESILYEFKSNEIFHQLQYSHPLKVRSSNSTFLVFCKKTPFQHSFAILLGN